jgi:MoaA/NifB/PqqE/SkfB family radical SAM enzyme
MHISSRCDQTCGHCAIWKGEGRGASLGREERLEILAEAKALGARSVLFTGGEPFLCDHIEALCAAARRIGLSVQIATNGLGLARAASWLSGQVDEIYVSLEGPEGIHDSVRGPGMFVRMAASVGAVRALRSRPRLVARSVLSIRNAAVIAATVEAARSLGFDAISFLPVDVSSDAFGGDPKARSGLRPDPSAIRALRSGISVLASRGELGRFVTEDARKLASMADAFEAPEERQAPPCNAPEWSSVVEADGNVRPCFFQPVVGRVEPGSSLGRTRESEAYRKALLDLGPGNAVCRTCVCPKQMTRSQSLGVRASLERLLPGLFSRERVPA